MWEIWKPVCFLWLTSLWSHMLPAEFKVKLKVFALVQVHATYQRRTSHHWTRPLSNIPGLTDPTAMSSESNEPKKKRRRKGGLRQRLAAAEESDKKQQVTSSHLGQTLLEKWAWGLLSPQEVQDMAAKATLDFNSAGAQPPADLELMASLGSSGTYKKLGCKLGRCRLNMSI